MPAITFELDIPPGLVSDDTPFAAKGAWSDGNNVRFWNGRPQVIAGWLRLYFDPLDSAIHGIFPITIGASSYLVYGTTAKI